MAGSGGTPAGASGAGMVAGNTGVSGAGTGGTSGAAGTPGVGGTPAGAAGASAGTGGGGGGGADITQVVPTEGCGKAPGPTGRQTIPTMGTKDADCAAQVCGDWQWDREYAVTLPQNYDMNKPYSIVFQGPGCGGNYQGVYDLDGNAGNTAIRVGLTPAPNEAGHGTNPNKGCFDDKEGDDSLDWVFYETLYDRLATQFCFDKNRVFASGNSSGAWFSNELGCKYAGDATRPVRGIMPNTGGLPAEAEFKPTCTTKPMAGMWIHEKGDGTNPFEGTIRAVTRAMSVNSCTMGNSYETATFENFPIGGDNPDTRCKRIVGCDPLYPLVVCALDGGGHAPHDNVANPGFSTFIKLFSSTTTTPPFLTP
ncbi:MAG TPA: hypothetical protein VJN18_07670 [Polyangiaceae bacterium]|nr:hypothetical protein [Polyangiaceae bacterium]